MSLEVRDITFSYDRVRMCKKPSDTATPVLEGFGMEFPFGEITALAGDNGVGKSTLARIIMGILKPAAGSIYVDGSCIDSLSVAERGRLIGYAMQNPSKQIFSKTVVEEVEYGLTNLNLENTGETAAGYLEMFGLSHKAEEFPFTLSHGEKQRLVLASILAMKPRYLILDEPTAGLDIRHKQVLGEMLRDIAMPSDEKNCPGCGVVVISHDRKFVAEYCDNIRIMKKLPQEVFHE